MRLETKFALQSQDFHHLLLANSELLFSLCLDDLESHRTVRLNSSAKLIEVSHDGLLLHLCYFTQVLMNEFTSLMDTL